MLFSSTSTSLSLSFKSVVILTCFLMSSVLSTPSFHHQNSLLSKRATNAKQITLGSACPFTLLAKTGIAASSANSSAQGDIGIAPVAQTAFTGFTGQVSHGTPVEYITADQFTGKGYSADDSNSPSQAAVDAALGAGNTAPTISSYNQGLNQVATSAAYTDYQAGVLGGPTPMQPGVYVWGGAVSIPVGATVTLNGSCGDVFIMRSTGAITTGTMSNVVLTGGLTSASVFWICTGVFTTGAAPSNFSGIVLAAGNIAVAGSINGMLYSRMDISLGPGTKITRPGTCQTPQNTCFATSCDTACNSPRAALVQPSTTTPSAVTSTITSTLQCLTPMTTSTSILVLVAAQQPSVTVTMSIDATSSPLYTVLTCPSISTPACTPQITSPPSASSYIAPPYQSITPPTSTIVYSNASKNMIKLGSGSGLTILFIAFLMY